MDPITVAIVSGVIVPIVAAGAWTVAFRSGAAADLLERAAGRGPFEVYPPDAPPTIGACRSCGTPYPPVSRATFCRHCGHRMKGPPPASDISHR